MNKLAQNHFYFLWKDYSSSYTKMTYELYVITITFPSKIIETFRNSFEQTSKTFFPIFRHFTQYQNQ